MLALVFVHAATWMSNRGVRIEAGPVSSGLIPTGISCWRLNREPGVPEIRSSAKALQLAEASGLLTQPSPIAR